MTDNNGANGHSQIDQARYNAATFNAQPFQDMPDVRVQIRQLELDAEVKLAEARKLRAMIGMPPL